MTIGMVFWLLMILWLVFGVWGRWPNASPPPPFVSVAGSFLEFVLFFLLGWKVFGFVIQG